MDPRGGEQRADFYPDEVALCFNKPLKYKDLSMMVIADEKSMLDNGTVPRQTPSGLLQSNPWGARMSIPLLPY